ncbi:MAG: dipeptide epimerase [Labilithrix sp.]|nr:dipeptide epimerase [Labilithrix sp.]
MSTPILSLGARRLDVPMKKAFGIAGGAQVEANNVLVELRVRGASGFGEGAPFPAFNGETQARVLAAVARAAPRLEGVDLEDDAGLREVVRAWCSDSPSATCAIETAVFDARARLRGTSIREMLGGAERELVTDVTITTGSVEDASREARALSAFRTLKIKVGGGDPDSDVARVLAVRAVRPDARLLVDANGGFALDDAVRFAAGARSAGIELFEQPVAPGDWDALAEVRERTGLRVAIDESVTVADDVGEAKRRGATDAVNVKIMKSGIFEALAIIQRTRDHGLFPMIGGMVETRLAMGMSASIAAGLGGFAYVDLDTPLFLASDPFEGGYAQDGERIDLGPIGAGHGARPRAST